MMGAQAYFQGATRRGCSRYLKRTNGKTEGKSQGVTIKKKPVGGQKKGKQREGDLHGKTVRDSRGHARRGERDLRQEGNRKKTFNVHFRRGRESRGERQNISTSDGCEPPLKV